MISQMYCFSCVYLRGGAPPRATSMNIYTSSPALHARHTWMHMLFSPFIYQAFFHSVLRGILLLLLKKLVDKHWNEISCQHHGFGEIKISY